MAKRIKSLLLALAMFITLAACKGNDSLEVESSEPDISNSIESSKPSENVEIVTETVEPIQEIEKPTPLFIVPAITNVWGLESPEIQSELAKIENGESFQFTFVAGFVGHNGMGSCYGIMGDYFKQVAINGKKCLVYAEDESKILASDYDFLGMPFYLFGYDQANGGKDSNSAYSGWVLPTYTYIDEVDPYSGRRLYTYNLYDYEDFQLLLKDCTPDDEFFTYGSDFYGMKGPVFPFYLRALDPVYNGPDDANTAAGYAVIIERDGIKYLVDANDFSKIYCKDFTGVDMVEDKLIVKIYPNDEVSGTEIYFKAEDIKPFYSDVLRRDKRIK